MKTSPQRATGDERQPTPSHKDDDNSSDPGRSFRDEAAPLPHEADQSAESQHEDGPRGVGKQAHRDLERGLEDTDRRGGDEYQERTQNDAHANENSAGERRKH